MLVIVKKKNSLFAKGMLLNAQGNKKVSQADSSQC